LPEPDGPISARNSALLDFEAQVDQDIDLFACHGGKYLWDWSRTRTHGRRSMLLPSWSVGFMVQCGNSDAEVSGAMTLEIDLPGDMSRLQLPKAVLPACNFSWTSGFGQP